MTTVVYFFWEMSANIPRSARISGSISTDRRGRSITRVIPCGTGSTSPISGSTVSANFAGGGQNHAPRPRPPPQLVAEPQQPHGRVGVDRNAPVAPQITDAVARLVVRPGRAGEHRAQGLRPRRRTPPKHVHNPPKITRVPHIHRTGYGLHRRARMKPAPRQVLRHDVVLVGRGDEASEGHSERATRDQAGREVAEVSRRDRKDQLGVRSRRRQLGPCVQVIEGLGEEAADVDGVGGSERQSGVEVRVGEGSADESLAVVEGAADGHGGDVAAQGRELGFLAGTVTLPSG